MAIKGVSRKPIPFIPEEERAVKENQTVFWITPKTGHEANKSMSRYAAAGRDGRKGFRELDVTKLDNADLQEFLDIISKVENFAFPEDEKELSKKGVIPVIDDAETLRKIALYLSPDLLVEIFEAANNFSILKAGEKKNSK